MANASRILFRLTYSIVAQMNVAKDAMQKNEKVATTVSADFEIANAAMTAQIKQLKLIKTSIMQIRTKTIDIWYTNDHFKFAKKRKRIVIS